MEPSLIDSERTFGIELEGVIEGTNTDDDEYINTREHGCECECDNGGCDGCYGECECHALCDCEYVQDEFARNSPDAEHTEIDGIQCDYCTGDSQCDYCNEDCNCRYCLHGYCDRCIYCDGECECHVCVGRCEFCLNDMREHGSFDEGRKGLANFISQKANVSCYSEHWNTHTRPYWKVITDSSINCGSYEQDIEVVSPVLKGIEGLEEVKKVVDAMKDFGVQINRSTGLHVHHDSNNLNAYAFSNLVKLYAFYEGALDSLMPRSRRGRRPYYIHAVKYVFNEKTAMDLSKCIDEMLENEHEDDFLNELLAKSHYERYCKLNLQAISKHGTIEFRHHSGTTNSDKVIAWIELTQNILNYCNNSRTRITPNHVPNFSKLLLLTKCRKELKEHLYDRRKHFLKEYKSFNHGCTDHKEGYNNE